MTDWRTAGQSGTHPRLLGGCLGSVAAIVAAALREPLKDTLP